MQPLGNPPLEDFPEAAAWPNGAEIELDPPEPRYLPGAVDTIEGPAQRPQQDPVMLFPDEPPDRIERALVIRAKLEAHRPDPVRSGQVRLLSGQHDDE
jgi:hypothetical protein